MRLKDKIAIVTGAGAGMGGAVAVAYAREGATVVVVDIDEALGRATAQRILDSGGRASFVHADVSDAKSVESMVQTDGRSLRRRGCAVHQCRCAILV